MDTQTKANNAIKWIDGLLTTDLPRGKGCLKDISGGFCCLGVGCEILKIPYIPAKVTSHELKNDVGLIKSNGYFGDDNVFNGQRYLTDLNDLTSMSFKEIGEFIQTHIEWLFEPEVAQLINSHYNSQR